jgi:hypothetical protein
MSIWSNDVPWQSNPVYLENFGCKLMQLAGGGTGTFTSIQAYDAPGTGKKWFVQGTYVNSTGVADEMNIVADSDGGFLRLTVTGSASSWVSLIWCSAAETGRGSPP